MTDQIRPSEDSNYDFYFGPAHPGSGNFGVRLKVRGEEVIEAKADPGYLHRGFEKLMEYRNPIQNAVLSDRVCVFEPLNWNLIHAEAVERLMGKEVPEKAKWIRVLMVELSRIQSHLIWYAGTSLGIGFDTGFKLALSYRDYILDLFENMTGGRVYPAGYITPGGMRRDLPNGWKEKVTWVLKKLDRMVEFGKLENPVLEGRMKGVGKLKLMDAKELGATGPVLRASGMKSDVRKEEPYEIYSKLDFEIPCEKEGDALARYSVGFREIEESLSIIKQVMEQMPPGRIEPVKPKPSYLIPEGEVFVRNEVARGEGAIHLVGDGSGNPYRCKIRGPSFLHQIPVLEHLLKGCQIADVPAIYWSLNPCPADMDR